MLKQHPFLKRLNEESNLTVSNQEIEARRAKQSENVILWAAALSGGMSPEPK